MALLEIEADKELSQIIGLIYDTIVDPMLWNTALKAIGTYVHADRVTLILEDIKNPLRSAVYQSYEDPDWTRRYLQHYMMINPMRLAMEPFAHPGDVILTSDFMAHEEYQKSRLARELLAERQLVDIAAAILEKTETTITVLSLKRNVAQGFADNELREKVKLLAPHARRAVSVARALEQQAARLDAMASALDKLDAAVLLLDAGGRIVECNSSAWDLMSEADMIANVEGKLAVRDLPTRAEYEKALMLAALGDHALDSSGAAMVFKSYERRFSGALMPLGDGARGAAPASAVALLCLREVKLAQPHHAAIIADLYNLTRRETSVLVSVVELGGARETAAVLGLTQGTVKGYLKSIFRKTETTRQSDLVKLVAATALPVR